MAMAEDWEYVKDPKRFSGYVSSEIFNAIERYQEEHGLDSKNRAINEILDTHLSECETNSLVYQPILNPRFSYDKPEQPSSIEGGIPSPVMPAFCTIPEDTSSLADSTPTLYIQNNGLLPAQDVRLEIDSRKGKKLDKVGRYVLAPGEAHQTKVDLSSNPHVIISGSYTDSLGRKQQFNKEIRFPPC